MRHRPCQGRSAGKDAGAAEDAEADSTVNYADPMAGQPAVRPTVGPADERSADGVAAAIDNVGDAWSWLLLHESIVCGVSRFDGFQQHLGIARSTLAARLESLCENGLLVRDVVAKPEYHPTPAGRAFSTCLLMAMNWGDRWEPAPSGPSLSVEHVGCGSRAGVEMRCASCHLPTVAREVTFDEIPPAPAPAAHGRIRVPGLELLERNGPNSVARTLKVTGDRWSSLVLRGAFFGLRRFDEFERALGIAPNILSQRLIRLTELDILNRTPYAVSPRRHEYRLTDRGLGLYPMYLAMLSWGVTWAGARADALRLHHAPCGQDLLPVVCCTACGREAAADQLRLHRRFTH